MKKRLSQLLGVILLMIGIFYVKFIYDNPSLSQPFGARLTYLFYGSYIWFTIKFLLDDNVFRMLTFRYYGYYISLVEKFLTDIPVFQQGGKVREGHFLNVAIIIVASILAFMELLGASVGLYTILRGFVIAGAIDLCLDYVFSESDA